MAGLIVVCFWSLVIAIPVLIVIYFVIWPYELGQYLAVRAGTGAANATTIARVSEGVYFASLLAITILILRAVRRRHAVNGLSPLSMNSLRQLNGAKTNSPRLPPLSKS